MEVANTGAYDAGGFSIGIPIGGRNQLKMESRVASDVQTNTIITTGYKERLPLLGNHKELIIVLPGGGGTMREIAMALIKMRDEPTSTFQLIFMDVKYYKGLLKWLYAQNIPEFILSRIHIIDNSNELKPLINALLDYRKIDANKLFSQPKPDGPRSDRTSFRIKPRYYIEDFIQKIINAFKRIGF